MDTEYTEPLMDPECNRGPVPCTCRGCRSEGLHEPEDTCLNR